MKRLTFFLIEGGDGKPPFDEHFQIDAAQAMQAIEWSAQTGAHIELYYWRDGKPGCPDIGFCFLRGVYEGHGLGPTRGENSWLSRLAERASRYRGRPGSEMDLFFQTLLS